ncbi:MAG TPA: hypothetical protein VH988_21285 [Thermoanaerobaculia bacterium]|jgi:hypothetical protein|nr:hypothetical protein [Thermoanaerobaculia bacterium]
MNRQMSHRLFFLLLGCTAAFASSVQGQLVRGPEIVVNSVKTGRQGQPDVAVAPDGHSVVVWVNGVFPANVMARVLAADGTPRTGDIRVSTTEPDFQDHPRVAMAANGSFVVVWQARASQEGQSRVYGRRFGAGGQSLGSRFRLGIGYHLEQIEPDVACAPSGRFVVAWTENDGKFQPDGEPMTDVLARRFGADGHALETDWVAAGGWYNQYSPALAMNASGAFVIAVEGYDESDAHDDGSTYVYAMTYGPDRKLLHFILSGIFSRSQSLPAVALADDGSTILAWEDSQADNSDDEASAPGILAQRFDAAGIKAGSLIHVNTTITNVQSEPSLALAPNGFLVAWTSYGGRGGVLAQQFALDGTKIGAETALATRTAGYQDLPAVALVPNGHGLAVWQSQGSDGDDLGVSARRIVAQPH